MCSPFIIWIFSYFIKLRDTFVLHVINSLHVKGAEVSCASNQGPNYSGKVQKLHHLFIVFFSSFQPYQYLLLYPQNQSKRFRQLLVSWIKSSGFTRTVVLSSSHAYQRDDQQMQGYSAVVTAASSCCVSWPHLTHACLLQHPSEVPHDAVPAERERRGAEGAGLDGDGAIACLPGTV